MVSFNIICFVSWVLWLQTILMSVLLMWHPRRVNWGCELLNSVLYANMNSCGIQGWHDCLGDPFVLLIPRSMADPGSMKRHAPPDIVEWVFFRIYVAHACSAWHCGVIASESEFRPPPDIVECSFVSKCMISMKSKDELPCSKRLFSPILIRSVHCSIKPFVMRWQLQF